MSRLSKIIVALSIIASVFIVILFIPSQNPSASETMSKEFDKDIVLYIGSNKALVYDVETSVDSLNKEVTPVVQNGVKLVPVRFISEALGAEVGWDSKTSTASVTLGKKIIRFKQGSNLIKTGEATVKLDAPVQVIKGRTFVPLTQFAEILGKKVFYHNGLIIIGNGKNFPDPTSDKSIINLMISRVNKLPSVDSHEMLKKLLEKTGGNRNKISVTDEIMKSEAAMSETVSNAAESMLDMSQTPTSNSAKASSEDHSTTNVQVQGVDEADIVKTDGQYIYQVNKQRIVIARAYPAEKMQVESIISFGNINFSPMELYLHDQKMVVIGATGIDIPIYRDKASDKPEMFYYRPYQSAVRIIVYDITDKSNLKEIRTVDVEGSYVSSRKTGSNLYLVSNRYMDYYYIQEGNENLSPLYRDSLKGDEFTGIDYKSMYYFPGEIEPNYLIVAGLNLDKIDKKLEISTYLGASQNIYASRESLFIAATGWSETVVYKFAFDMGKVVYIGKGEVPGTILNQFSMDEDNGYFRIATTKGDIWRNDENTSQNNVYILDEMLNITGRIENIAPGEKIYSVRFMGKRGYVVTFKTVDPLFVLDLEDPEKPSILGALKIPGYSDYLHPYDENHIIGFGKDTVEIKGQAYYLGMKIAMFDVSDVTRPKQMFSELIGDRGTDSEILRNHKALLFSKSKGLMAFPITVMEVSSINSNDDYGKLQYGEFSFQGAYVYSVDLTNGFKLKGKITHLSEQDYLKAGNYWYDSDKNIQRILYIDDTLYTLSNSMFKAHGIPDMKEKNNLKIPS